MKAAILEVLWDPETGKIIIISNDHQVVANNIEQIIAELMYKYDAIPPVINSSFQLLAESSSQTIDI